MNLLDRIEAIWTGNKKLQLPHLDAFLIEEEDNCSVSLETEKQYRIGVSYYWSVYCQPSELNHMIKRVRDELKHVLYSDFIKDLYELRRAIAYENKKKSLDLIDQLFNKIQ